MIKYSLGLFLVFWGIMTALYLPHGTILATTDAMISVANVSPQEVANQMLSNWGDSGIIGSARGAGINIPGMLRYLICGITWNNIVYQLACFLASLVFVRSFQRRFSYPALLCGALAAFWLGSNFTLIYAGHGLKPYVILFFVCSLFPVSRAASGSVSAALLWGSFVGLMFVQQPDVALFFSLFSGAYMLFHLWLAYGFWPSRWMKILIPAGVLALLFAVGPLLNGYKYQIKNSSQMQETSSQEKWDYITQWSFPPEESIAFIAPGYTGWRSGEPNGPYWGRMGRSSGWERAHQGFQNFKLENTYLGFIPVAFALFALFSCRNSKYRAEILFWGGSALVALLLAFGKFFPLYALFYHLPVVNNIRNPNKFLQVFQVCLAILTAYGFDALFLRQLDSQGKTVKHFFWVAAGGFAILAVFALSSLMNRPDGVAGFMAQGWPADAAKVIVSNQIHALWHAAFMAAAVAAVFAIFVFSMFEKVLRFKNFIAAGLVLLVAGDALALARHYVLPMPRSYIEANPLTDFLKRNLGHQRVALLSQQGIFGLWTTYLLPYNKISMFNFSDMPRMANDYQAFLTAGQNDPLSMWRFSAVKYLLAPSSVEKQLVPANCRKGFCFDVIPAENGGYRIVPDMKGPYSVFELLETLPRYALFAGSRKRTDGQALGLLSDLSTVILPPESTLPELSGTGQTGKVEVLSYRPGKVTLSVKSEVPAVLRCAEKYDADWKASVDGVPVAVGRVDYLCQGVAVPAGAHTVKLWYAPSRLFFYMQCAGYLVLCGTAVMVWRRKDGHGSD
ncbi:MAG: hypothetical protein AB7E95_03530 [Kiritimatiellales bacterium]